MVVPVLFVLAAAAQAPREGTYFQQDVTYRIEATLDDAAGVLRARARMRYTNRSPRTLDTLYFHLHLNAFRPNSAWARRDLQFANRRFQDLGPNDYAFERITSIRVSGRDVQPKFPGGQDSTVLAVPLPQPIRTGGIVTVDFDWSARPSTTPRRQGRRGRHLDFAQWYPRIAVYDKGGWEVQQLLPQGEFYGEFATFDVTLDRAQDQVVGATGVPVQGDPGWEKAAAPGTSKPVYQRTAYAPQREELLGYLSSRIAPGRKRVRFHAEHVHHFAWSTAPDYIYEGGKLDNVAIHVLYQPGDTAWANSAAVKRTANALAFYGDLFGKYPYPQITNVHRIEGGGTEFPMMVMNGSASEGLILHEVGHQWMAEVLANNEWKEGWLDEGFNSFTNNWYNEKTQGLNAWTNDIRTVFQLDSARKSEPLAKAAKDFSDFNIYNAMTYTKPAVVLRMLRDYLGEDVTRRALRDFWTRHQFQHVTGDDLRAAFERASGQNLEWFFQQWFKTVNTLDYSIGTVTTTRGADGNWRTRVEVKRAGEAWMPVVLKVGENTRTLDSRERTQTVEIITADRPTEVVLDPKFSLIDSNPANNRKSL
jgi:hypothetical protein